MDHGTGFTRGQASAISGLSPRQLKALDHSGVLSPAVNSSSGRGSVAVYDRFDLLCLMALSELSACLGGEIRLGWARPAAKALGALRGAELEGTALICEREGASVMPTSSLEAALSESGAGAVVLLGRLERLLDARLAREFSLVPQPA